MNNNIWTGYAELPGAFLLPQRPLRIEPNTGINIILYYIMDWVRLIWPMCCTVLVNLAGGFLGGGSSSSSNMRFALMPCLPVRMISFINDYMHKLFTNSWPSSLYIKVEVIFRCPHGFTCACSASAMRTWPCLQATTANTKPFGSSHSVLIPASIDPDHGVDGRLLAGFSRKDVRHHSRHCCAQEAIYVRRGLVGGGTACVLSDEIVITPRILYLVCR